MADFVLATPRFGSWLSSLLNGCGTNGCGGNGGPSNQTLEGQVSGAVISNLAAAPAPGLRAKDPLQISNIVHATMTADPNSYTRVKTDPAYTLSIVQSVINTLQNSGGLVTTAGVQVYPVGSTPPATTGATSVITTPTAVTNNNLLIYAGVGLGALSLLLSMRRR